MLKYSRRGTAKASNYFYVWYDGRSWTQTSTGTTMPYLCFLLLTSLPALLGSWCRHFTLYEIALGVNEQHYCYLSKASDWNCCPEHPWCWQNNSIFMLCGQNCHSYLDLHHVHKVPWKICWLCMWGNGSENTDNFQNASFEFQCLLLVLANSELLLVHTKSLTLHVKYVDLTSV